MASHVGSRLLADLADRSGLTGAVEVALAGTRRRRSAHDPGRVLTDVAVMLADGGRGISGLAVLRDRPELVGAVASTATAWRVLDSIDSSRLGAIRGARAQAREQLWGQRAETVGPIPASRAGGRECPGLRLVVDATLVTCHSDKELASATFKGGFGYHPLTVWLDTTNEALAAVLRTGKAGSNTTADHVAVTDLALAQIPDEHRHGTPSGRRRAHRPAPAPDRGGLAGRDARAGAPGTAPPGCAADLHRPRRLAVRRPSRPTRRPGSSRSWKPGTGRTPGSRTGSAARSRPG